MLDLIKKTMLTGIGLALLAKDEVEGLAKELVYTARDFKAEEAKAVGFVNEVYRDQETMIEAVMKLAKQIAEHSPATVTGCKNMINYSRDHSLVPVRKQPYSV